jgi:hypothetical protein
MSHLLKKFEVKSTVEVTRWINDDIKPIEAGRRTWTFWTFHNYCTHITSSSPPPLSMPNIGFVVLSTANGSYYRGADQLQHLDLFHGQCAHRAGLELVAGYH